MLRSRDKRIVPNSIPSQFIPRCSPFMKGGHGRSRTLRERRLPPTCIDIARIRNLDKDFKVFYLQISIVDWGYSRFQPNLKGLNISYLQ